MESVTRVLDEAYLDVDKGLAANRPRTFTTCPTTRGRFTANTHEGVLASKGVYNIRIVTHPVISKDEGTTIAGHAPLNVSLDLLYDTESGDLLAIIQDGHLQKMRVQATNAIAARCMARKNTRRMALLGSGWQATAAISAMRLVRPIEEVKVYSRDPERRRKFAEEMGRVHEGILVKAVDGPQEAVRGADIIVCATNSKVAVCKGEWLEKGMHLTGVLPAEFDLECYRRADYVVIFNRLHGRDYKLNRGPEEAPLKPPPHAELLKDAPEIIDLVSGKAPGRKDDDQITIFANGGHGWGLDGGPGYGIQFTAVAKLVYDLARERGVGRELPLEWFQQNVHS
jgi:ornithine cyclodeaminase/alanine dehydrogenase-like protein (mu-crystallin family)